MAQKVVFITTTGTGTFTVPGDFGSLVSVEAIGGGGTATGGNGAGGGAYAKSTSMVGLSAYTIAFYSVGAGGANLGGAGGDSWFSLTNSVPAASSSGAIGVLAKGGAAVNTGGASASCTGDLRYSGGAGGTTPAGGNGGGGGAAGPGGVGGAGGTGSGTPNGCGGGGGSGAILSAAGTVGENAVLSTRGGNGGASAGQTGGSGAIISGSVNSTAGTNGGGGGGGCPGTGIAGGAGGSNGSYWTSTQLWNGTTLSNSVATAGSGGGVGGAGQSGTGGGPNAGQGGLYGGGGGIVGLTGYRGAQGIIVFTYNPSTNSGFKKSDDVFGTIDLDDQYVTDSWLVDKYVGGTLFAFGSGTNGGLGLGNNTYYSSPIQVGSLTSWRYVSVNSSTALTLRNISTAIKTDGTLWAWGENRTGQLGQNYVTNTYSSPIQVGSFTNWKQVSAGCGYVLAVKTDGTLWAWGWNGTGQLGLGYAGSTVATGGYYSSPVQVGALTNWKQVSASAADPSIRASSAALKTDGTLWTWGNNTFGQLGIGVSTSGYYSNPIQVGSLTNWKQVSVGYVVSVANFGWMAAVKTDGTLWTWGVNTNGQLGLGFAGATSYYSSPVQVGALTNWKQVSTGGASCLAIKTDGTLWAWGSNGNGQLGNGNRTYYSSPIQVGSLTNWKQVSCQSDGSVSSTLAVKTDGTLWAWGSGTSGQLGQNNTTSYSSPIQVGSLTNWKYVDAGGNHTLGITFTDLN